MNRVQTLLEPAGKAMLAEAGIQVPAGETVETADQAVDAAESIGYPVVVKVVVPGITHKSEWGGGVGVQLDCQTADAVRSAAQRILEVGLTRESEIELLVEEAIPTDDGLETLVSGLRDPTFGPVVGFGIGGTTVELFDDMAYRLAPLDTDTAQELLDEPRLSPVLDGYRGGPRVDRDQLATVIVRVGELLEADDQIRELEINPLFVTEESAVALDALVTLIAEDRVHPDTT